MRLDIRRLPSGLREALVTPRWGTPVTYSVSVEPHFVVLTGQPELNWPLPGAAIADTGLRDTWNKLRIAFDASTGVLGGTGSTSDLQAIGDEFTINTDTAGKIAELSAGGTVVRDSTTPQIRSEVSSPILPAGVLLPWENLAVRAAEGIDPTPLFSGIVLRRVEDAGAGTASVSWSFAPTEATTSWSGMLTATGSTRSWDGLPGAIMEIAVVGAAVVDSTKLEMAADYQAAFQFANIGPAVASHALGGEPLPASWGSVTFWSAAQANPICESGGCAVLGPFDRGFCSVRRLGIAGHLSLPAVDAQLGLLVRYRVMRARPIGAGADASPFSIDIAVPAREPVSTEVSLPALNDIGGDAGDLRYASEFVDVRVPVSDTGPMGDASQGVGFAIYAGSKGAISCPPPFMDYPIKTQVVIDQITLEPMP